MKKEREEVGLLCYKPVSKLCKMQDPASPGKIPAAAPDLKLSGSISTSAIAVFASVTLFLLSLTMFFYIPSVYFLKRQLL